MARIVLARPAVEAGEKLGFLPGDLQEKVDPYLRPLYDALYDLLDYEEGHPPASSATPSRWRPSPSCAGARLNDAFVIIDEAQNTTTEQMKMVLTRIGFGSKVVMTGDITQIDLPAGKNSGLIEAISVLAGVKGIAFSYFDDKDVVRHQLVQAIVKAYEAYGSPAQARPSRPWCPPLAPWAWCFSCKQRRRAIDEGRLRRVLRGAARALRVSGEVAVVLAGDRTLRV